MNRFFSGFVGLSLFVSLRLLGQSISLPVQADLVMYGASAAQLPFWFRTNQWGSMPVQSPAASLQLSTNKAYKPTDSLKNATFDWGFGLNVVGNLEFPSTQTRTQLLLPEAYLKMKVGRFELWGGRRRQIIGLVDSVLSSGSYVVSGNAMPIPQIQLTIPDYWPLGFLGNVVSIKGNFTHGWFNVPYIQGVSLHQKAMFLRLGRPSSPLHVTVGLNHEVMWGGHADYLKNSPFAVDGKLTTDFGDFSKSVVLGIIPRDIGNVRYSSFDAANRIGNHLGSMDFGVSLLASKASWFLYHQHPYDDASGLSWHNVPDGVYGLRWLNRQTNPTRFAFWRWRRLLAELVITTDQSGSYFSAPGQSFKGADNYYNHSQYVQGWSYVGQTIGTPFIMPRPTLNDAIEPGEFYLPNNRVIAYYTAFEAIMLNRIHLMGRFSLTRNLGTYSTPYQSVKSQFSGLISAKIPLPILARSELSLAIAVDNGGLLANKSGVRFGFHTYW